MWLTKEEGYEGTFKTMELIPPSTHASDGLLWYKFGSGLMTIF